MDPPKLTVTIHDLDSGFNVGYYCQFKCAIAEIPVVLETLAETGDVANLPDAFATIREPVLEMEPVVWAPGTKIEPGLTGKTPPYNQRSYAAAEKLAKDIFDNLYIATEHWKIQEQDYGWETNKHTQELKFTPTKLGFEIPYRERVLEFVNHDFSFTVGYSDTEIWITFPENVGEYNLTIDPLQFKMGRALEMVTSQIRMLVLKSERTKIPAPPAEGAISFDEAVGMPVPEPPDMAAAAPMAASAETTLA